MRPPGPGSKVSVVSVTGCLSSYGWRWLGGRGAGAAQMSRKRTSRALRWMKRAALLDVLAHQGREQLVGLGRVVEGDLEQDAVRRVHRGVPQLVGVHLAEALVALDRVLLGQLAAGLDARRPSARRARGRCRRTRASALRPLASCTAAAARGRRGPTSTSGRMKRNSKREQQGADVLAVDVGVGHQDDLVIAQLVEVEVVVDAGAERGDQRLDLVVLRAPCRCGPSRR